MKTERLLNEHTKVVFFKIENDGTHTVSNDFRVINETKTGGLKVVKNYNGRTYPSPKFFWIKSSFLNTTSEYWQPSSNSPKY